LNEFELECVLLYGRTALRPTFVFLFIFLNIIIFRRITYVPFIYFSKVNGIVNYVAQKTVCDRFIPLDLAPVRYGELGRSLAQASERRLP
jgi:hypothetical protein